MKALRPRGGGDGEGDRHAGPPGHRMGEAQGAALLSDHTPERRDPMAPPVGQGRSPQSAVGYRQHDTVTDQLESHRNPTGTGVLGGVDESLARDLDERIRRRAPQSPRRERGSLVDHEVYG